MSNRRPRAGRALVGVMDHAGWAVLITVRPPGALLDRRRVALTEAGLPVMPHHHEGQRLELAKAVALVRQVERSAQRCSEAALSTLAAELGVEPTGIALRVCPPLPGTVEARIQNYRAMCVADWVMYRRALAAAATARGWAVHWYEPKQALDEADRVLGGTLKQHLAAARAEAGAPWQKDHQLAMAAAIAASKTRRRPATRR
ncbi:MAG: hypothetical protein K1X89_25270 [Myxococcaceae bacterium]|nr:hypothetical protein [Myxococcaceae bacterium]